MSQRSIRRSLLIFVLAFVATSSAMPAATLEGRFPGGLEAIWSRLAYAFELRFSPRLKVGCSIDPNGQPACEGWHGCTIDPNGQPICQVKHGCSIDPNGKPVCTP